jgi:hypothetical protein
MGAHVNETKKAATETELIMNAALFSNKKAGSIRDKFTFQG